MGKVSFSQWLIDNQLDDAYRIYDYFFNQIKDTAAEVSIDLDVNDLDVSRGGKNNRVRALEKDSKGKLVAFVTLQDKQGVKMPYFRFYTNKGGGVDAVFSTYNALWELYKSQQPVDFAAKPTPAPKAPKKPVVTDLQTALWMCHGVGRITVFVRWKRTVRVSWWRSLRCKISRV